MPRSSRHDDEGEDVDLNDWADCEECGPEPVAKSRLVRWIESLHPRGPDGRFIPSFGRRAHESQGAATTLAGARRATIEAVSGVSGEHGGPDTLKGRIKARLGKPIECHGDVDKAARLLAAGHAVELDQPEQASTLVDVLAQVVREMERAGLKAPNFDLCRVSVKHTNLFCEDNKGIPRVQMPQLSGKPLKNSPADKLPRDKRGNVDLGPGFLAYLKERGIPVFERDIPPENLRASQRQLDGRKVSEMRQAEKRGQKIEGRIWTSRDQYIIDGHHRWATEVARDAEDGTLGNSTIKVEQADAKIPVVLALARQYAREQGLPQRGIKDGWGPEPSKPPQLPEVSTYRRMNAAIDKAMDSVERRAGLPPGEGPGIERLKVLLARILDLIHYGYFKGLKMVPADIQQEIFRFSTEDHDPDDIQRKPQDANDFLSYLHEHEADLLYLAGKLARALAERKGLAKSEEGEGS